MKMPYPILEVELSSAFRTYLRVFKIESVQTEPTGAKYFYIMN
jgi:hypothetical protein